jgi:hypothetical protein
MTAPTPARTQHRHDADDLVTDEMIGDAFCAWHGARGTDAERIDAALRAVAPMIVARVARADTATQWVAAEREACAKIAADRAEEGEHGTWQAQEGLIIAAAIRARGETK